MSILKESLFSGGGGFYAATPNKTKMQLGSYCLSGVIKDSVLFEKSIEGPIVFLSVANIDWTYLPNGFS